MYKNIIKSICLLIVGSLFFIPQVYALDMGTKAEIENLRKRINQLEKKQEEEGAAEEITTGEDAPVQLVRELLRPRGRVHETTCNRDDDQKRGQGTPHRDPPFDARLDAVTVVPKR